MAAGRDLIDDLALLAHPEPRHGEVDDDMRAFVDDARDGAAHRRQEYAEDLRAFVDDTGDDPLLTELRIAAARRDEAEGHLRCLIAYARYHTGTRPDYTWEAVATAAGLPYSTARRAISQVDVDRVQDILDTPARRSPDVVASGEGSIAPTPS